MLFTTFGNPTHKTLMLVHGLGVSYQVFAPLIAHLQEHYHIIAVQVDGFLLDAESKAIPPCSRVSIIKWTSWWSISARHTTAI